LFPAPVYKTYGGLIAGGKFEPAGFAASLGRKDIRLTLAAAESLQMPMPVTVKLGAIMSVTTTAGGLLP
jgi:3-hydroxyisobutyrate dehydrogenase-like beta-hydroxyacid dehydrogenase